MRILFIFTLVISGLLNSQLVAAPPADSQTTQKVYPNTPLKDFVFDAPWRVSSADEPIPFILEIGDANRAPISELRIWTLMILGEDTPFYSEDFGSTGCVNENETDFTSS